MDHDVKLNVNNRIIGKSVSNANMNIAGNDNILNSFFSESITLFFKKSGSKQFIPDLKTFYRRYLMYFSLFIVSSALA